MAQIPIPSHLVTDLKEEGTKVILTVHNGVKFICDKKHFSNYGKFKTSIQQQKPGNRNKPYGVRPITDSHRSRSPKFKRHKSNQVFKNEASKKRAEGRQV